MTGLLSFLLGGVAVGAAVWARRTFLEFWGQKPEDYKGTGPEFELREHLKGPIVCEGVIFGPTGRVTSRFTADMHGSWDGNKGVLSEKFTYCNGDVQEREWHLTLGNDGKIKANADDVIGDGEGHQDGAAVHLKYKYRLPETSGGHVLDASDWLYLVEDGKIINRSQFRKYGVKVAELVATMRKADAA